MLADGQTDWQTDRLTDAKRFYNLFHAICYIYGTDNKCQNCQVSAWCTTPPCHFKPYKYSQLILHTKNWQHTFRPTCGTLECLWRREVCWTVNLCWVYVHSWSNSPWKSGQRRTDTSPRCLTCGRRRQNLDSLSGSPRIAAADYHMHIIRYHYVQNMMAKYFRIYTRTCIHNKFPWLQHGLLGNSKEVSLQK